MLIDAVRRVAALRQPGRARRLALALWIAWAVIVWNAVFDHVIVVAGRAYIIAARRAAATPAPDATAVRMDDFMRPAVTRGLWIASAAGGGILLAGLTLMHRARVDR